MTTRYTRWDGTQDPLGDTADIGDVLQQLGDDLLAGAGGRQALQRLQRRGIGGRAGLDELRDRIRRSRRALREQLDVDDALGWVGDRLDDVEALERGALADAEDDDAVLARLSLEALPDDVAGRFRGFSGHRFRSGEAAEAFDRLRRDLQQQLLDSHLRELAGGLDRVTPEDVAALTAMLAELNDMLQARERGEDVDFDGFMQRHGGMFPEHPEDLDELLEVLARRAMAMQQLLGAMTREQRAQLADLARQVFDDADLELELARLGDHLGRALSELDLDGVAPGRRDDPGPLGELVDTFERLGELDRLEEALSGEYAGATLEDVDEEALRRSLGQDAVRDLRRLRQLERQLEEAGVVRARDGELELTPRGARLLGERSLTNLLRRIRREPDTRRSGANPEPTGQTRPWRFGDREPIATARTIRNAVMRQAADGTVGDALRLEPSDLEVLEQEVRPRTATALLLDLSFSMPLQGHFVPAKRMALALHALIEGRHRQDSLHLIGFSDYARRLQPSDLAAAGFERVYGTNMHHAFLLARQVLGDDPRPVKQVIMVTDGEPTAHLVDGESRFSWPPVPETLEATLREGMRLARMGVALHVFLLEDAPGLVAFAERLASVTGGSVVQMTAEETGEAILSRYGDA